MTLKQPESMDDLIYMTRRKIDEKGRAVAWVFKGSCPKCKKGMMGKPKDEKTGKPKIRAKEYVCDKCGHIVEKGAYEETLECNIEYTCPHCGKDGEAAVPYKRRTFQGAPAVVFECASCGKKIGVTKKMKAMKSKKKADVPDDF